MKLKNLVEIIIGPDQVPHLSDEELAGIDFSSAKHIMNVEGLPLYVYDTYEYPDQKIYRILDGDTIVITIVGMVTMSKPNKIFKINRTLVSKEYQGKGYAKALYETLFNRLHYNVFSDYQLSKKTLNAWKKGWMIPSSYLYVYNIETREYKNIEDVDDNIIDNSKIWIYCILHFRIDESKHLFRLDVRMGDTLGAYVNTLHNIEIFDLE